MATVLASRGITNGDWAGIIAAIVLVVIPALAYASGRVRPLKLKARSQTLPLAEGEPGKEMTVVTVTARSRTRDTQTISKMALANWPPITQRLLHPRWRSSAEGFEITRFDSTSLPEGGLELPGKDAKRITGQTTTKYPPYRSTRLMLEGIRKRPWFVRIARSG
jgi:hypothetical protein